MSRSAFAAPVAVQITVNIARSADETETQARLGKALDRETMEEQREEEEAPDLGELLENPEDASPELAADADGASEETEQPA